MSKNFSDIVIGDIFTTGAHTITRNEIIEFAQQFDPQPMHLDEEAAKKTIFKELVASGWHMASLVMKLKVEAKPFGETPLVGLEVFNLTFKTKVLPKTRFHARIEIEDKIDFPEKRYGHLIYTSRAIEETTGQELMHFSSRVLVNK